MPKHGQTVLCHDIGDVWQLTLELFNGDRNAALEWFYRGNMALNGQTPCTVASRGRLGEQAVVELIGRLEHGVPS